MTWRIPPVGWCATCLRTKKIETAAVSIYNGTSLCRDHLGGVA